MATKLAIWAETNGSRPVRTPIKRAVQLSADGIAESMLTESQCPSDVIVLPIDPLEQAIGVTLVPEDMDGRVTRNGHLLQPGIHELRHTDRLEVNGQTLWVAENVTVRTVSFDPEKHATGPDTFCEITKGRIASGDKVVLCPGRPGAECTAVFKAKAWEMFLQSGASAACPQCGFRPNDADWEPPSPKERVSLDELFELIDHRKT